MKLGVNWVQAAATACVTRRNLRRPSDRKSTAANLQHRERACQLLPCAVESSIARSIPCCEDGCGTPPSLPAQLQLSEAVPVPHLLPLSWGPCLRPGAA
jgi:hypothetical protein